MPYNKKGTFITSIAYQLKNTNTVQIFRTVQVYLTFVVQQIKIKQTNKKPGLFIRRGTKKLCTAICILTPNGRMSTFWSLATEWTEVMFMNPLVLYVDYCFALFQIMYHFCDGSFSFYFPPLVCLSTRYQSLYSRSGISERETNKYTCINGMFINGIKIRYTAEVQMFHEISSVLSFLHIQLMIFF